MKRILRCMLFLAIAALTHVGVAQTGAPVPAPALQILTPKNGETINNDFVMVQYELASPVSAASTPTFRLRLDNHDPVQTTDTQYTFTGVPAGTHTISIQVVDANNTPIPGVQNQVQFTIQPQARTAPTSPSGQPGMASTAARLEPAALNSQNDLRSTPKQPANAPASGGNGLPKTGSSLPLLSVIGMGVLVGGIASALRTRSRSSRAR
jgi:LPXTG-motif cell wall-anchored protein